jgi:hypothetical protein
MGRPDLAPFGIASDCFEKMGLEARSEVTGQSPRLARESPDRFRVEPYLGRNYAGSDAHLYGLNADHQAKK